jgi:signal peptidase I
VGLPGERVVVGENDLTLFYPDRTQEYFSSTTLMGGGSAFYNALQHNMALGSQDMYVLGDNRQTSLDSRAFGAVQQGDIIGRVLWRMPWITLQ